MGPYRKNRIVQLIKAGTQNSQKLDTEYMKRMQLDVYSHQAEYYMRLLKPLLEEHRSTCLGCKVLLEWDKKFDTESRGAFLFDLFWKILIRESFGERVFGKNVLKYLTEETGIIAVYHSYFDRIMLHDIYQQEGISFQGYNISKISVQIDKLFNEHFGGRQELFKRIINDHIRPLGDAQIKKYGQAHNIIAANIFFDGQLPSFLGFDVGPIPVEGSSATINQVTLNHAQTLP